MSLRLPLAPFGVPSVGRIDACQPLRLASGYLRVVSVCSSMTKERRIAQSGFIGRYPVTTDTLASVDNVW